MNHLAEYNKWSRNDRDRLRDLAAVHITDAGIAAEMGRSETSVGWQRRHLRIKLASGKKVSGAKRDGLPYNEPDRHVERLLSLAKVATPSLRISEIRGFGASPFLGCDTLP